MSDLGEARRRIHQYLTDAVLALDDELSDYSDGYIDGLDFALALIDEVRRASKTEVPA